MVCPSVARRGLDALKGTGCVNILGLLVEFRLLALLESARTDPHNDSSHRRTSFRVRVTMRRQRLSHRIESLAIRQVPFAALRRTERAIDLVAREHIPANPDHLVGERDHGHLPMATRFDLPQPGAQCGLITLSAENDECAPESGAGTGMCSRAC